MPVSPVVHPAWQFLQNTEINMIFIMSPIIVLFIIIIYVLSSPPLSLHPSLHQSSRKPLPSIGRGHRHHIAAEPFPLQAVSGGHAAPKNRQTNTYFARKVLLKIITPINIFSSPSCCGVCFQSVDAHWKLPRIHRSSWENDRYISLCGVIKINSINFCWFFLHHPRHRGERGEYLSPN